MKRFAIAIRPCMRRSFGWLLLLVVTATAGLLIGNTAALGGQLKVTPYIGVKSQYDSNITYRSNNEIDDYILIINPGVGLAYNSGITKLEFNANMDLLRYLNENQLDDEHYRFNLSLQHLVTERFSFSVAGSYVADTTLDSELENTGYITGRSNREQYGGNLGMQYWLTELSSMGMGYSRSQTNYDGPNTVDSDSESVSLSYNRYFNDGLDTISLSPYYSSTSSTASDAKSYGLNVSWSHICSERTHLSFSLGARYTETDRDVTGYVLVLTPIPHLEARIFPYKTNNWGANGNLALTYEGDRWAANFGYSRGLSYSSLGDAIETDKLSTGATYNITERLRGRISGSIYRNKSEQEGIVDTWTYDFSPGVSYSLTENSNLDFSYSFSYAENNNQDGNNDITRHQVILSYRYNFPLEY